MKLNDWIVANLNNPDFSPGDFKEISGLNLDNTQFLDREEYKNTKFVTNHPLFKNEKGLFDEQKFDNYYDYQSEKFNEFIEDDQLYEREYSMWDTRANIDSKIINPNFLFISVPNPDRTSFGVAGINVSGKREKSKSELAQTQRIMDYDTGKFIDETPNDLALFKNPFKYIQKLAGKSLVLATYDEDQYDEDPITGLTVFHKKGDPKLNEFGTYYTETLGGRSPRGKQFIRNKDLITVDGTKINKYDFFDSDGITKDPGKVIANTIVSALPLAVLGPVGTGIYSALIIAKELSKTLPMLYSFVTMYNPDESALVNKIAGFGESHSRGTSEYAQEHMFSFENIGNLVADIALQWGQQKFIAKGISDIRLKNNKILKQAEEKAKAEYLKRSKELLSKVSDPESGIALDRLVYYTGAATGPQIDALVKSGAWAGTSFGKAAITRFVPAAQAKVQNAVKLGQDLSLVYMALISNEDVYDSAIEHGASKQQAAAIALISSALMFYVDRELHLGELFFDDEKAAFRRSLRGGFSDVAAELVEDIKKTGSIAANSNERVALYKLMQKAAGKFKQFLQNYNTGIKDKSLGFFGKAIGEGIEEVSEEVATDISKTIGEIAYKFGAGTTGDLGAWDNVLPRYAMNFLGGFMGGGMFYSINALQNPQTFNLKVTQDELLYYSTQNKMGLVIDELDKAFKRKDKMFGNYELSARTDSEGHFITADKNNPSIAETVYKRIRNMLITYDKIITDRKLKISEDDLFNRLVLGDQTLMALKDRLQGTSYFTNYQLSYQSLVEAIVQKQKEINEVNSKDSLSDEEKILLQAKQAEMKNLITERDRYISGEISLDYLEKLIWMIDPIASGRWIKLTNDQHARSRFNRSYDELSPIEQKIIDTIANGVNQTTVKDDVTTAWKEYKVFRDKIHKIVPSILEGDFLTTKNDFLSVGSRFSLNEALPEYSGIFGDFESEENVDISQIDKSKREEHLNALQQEERLQKVFTLLQSNELIDSNTARRIQLEISHRIKDIVRDTVEETISKYSSNLNGNFIDGNMNVVKLRIIQDITNILSTKDFSANINPEELKQQLKAEVLKQLPERISNQFDFFLKIYDSGIIPLEDLETTPLTLRNLAAATVTSGKIIPETGQLTENLDEQEYYKFAYKKIYEDSLRPENADMLDLDLMPFLFGIYNFNPTEEPVKTIIETINEDIDNLVDSIEDNPYVEALNEASLKVVTDKNAAVKLIQAVLTAQDLQDGFKDIEELLSYIHQQYQSGKTPEQFRLNASQVQSLNVARDAIQKAKAIIYSASTEESLDTPIGQNKQINRIIKKNSELFPKEKELLEIDQSFGDTLIYELDKYEDEINKWLELSDKNDGNRLVALENSKQALIKTQIDFLKVLKNVKLNANGKQITFDEVEIGDDNTLENLITAQHEIKTVFDSALEQYSSRQEGIKFLFDQIFAQGILRESKSESLQSQRLSTLNENLNYNDLSDYDLIIMLMTNLLYDQQEFYKYLKLQVSESDKVAPLFTQIYAEYVGLASYLYRDDINSVLDLIKERFEIEIPMLYNTTVITGIAGSGKTSVVINYINQKLKDKRVFIAGPSVSLVTNLSKLIPNASKSFDSIDDFVKYFFKDSIVSEVEELRKLNANESSAHFRKRTRDTYVLKDDVKDAFKTFKDEDLPEIIYFDEATYLANPYILLLSKLAKEKNFHIFLIGDETQSGNKKHLSLDKEAGFAIRSLRLDISLRSQNNHQNNNQLQLSNILIPLLDKFSDKIETSLRSVQFKYNLTDSNFSGTAITKELDDSFIKTIKSTLGSEEKVILVTNNENGLIAKQLQRAEVPYDPYNEESVQGKQSPYVIVDIDWNVIGGISYDKLTKDSDKNAFFYQQAKRLNTLITRAEKGTVIIDNNLSDKYVRPSSSSTLNTEVPGFSEQQIAKLKETFLAETLFLDSVEESTPEKTQETNEELKEQEDTEEENRKVFDGTTGNTSTISSKDIDKTPKEDADYEFKGYMLHSNINTLGLKREDLGVQKDEVYKRYKWINEHLNTKRDVAIVMTEDEVEDGNDKHDLVSIYRTFKNFLCTYLGEGRDKKDIIKKFVNKNNYLAKQVFGTDSVAKISKILESSKFFIEAKQLEDGYDSFVGMNTTVDEESTSDLKGSTIKIGSEQRFVRIYMQFEVNGSTLQITLGAVADPITWRGNAQDMAEAESKRTGESEKDIKDRIDNQINKYEEELAELLKTPVKEISPVIMSTGSEAVDFPTGSSIRVSSLIPGRKSRFERSIGGFTVSPIYIIDHALPGIDAEKAKKLLSKGAIYYTYNPVLSADELKDLYDASKSHEVRLLVLNNAGVDFESLISDTWKSIYMGDSTDESNLLPYKSKYFGARIFPCLWNFRSRLIHFQKIIDESGIDFNDDFVLDVLLKESDLYLKFKESGEKDFKKYCEDNTNSRELELLKKIWNINEVGLKHNEEFRIGTDSRNIGLYVRQLPGFKKGQFGIYINPKLSKQYLDFLNALFTDVIDKIIIPNEKLTPESIINLDETRKKNEDGTYDAKEWVKQVVFKKIQLEDEDGLIVELQVTDSSSAIGLLPTLLILLARKTKSTHISDPTHNKITYTDAVTDEEVELDINNLFSEKIWEKGFFGKRVYDESGMSNPTIGVNEIVTDEGDVSAIDDRRIMTLFKVMLHGLPWTKNFNDFEGDEPRAFVADFKYGIKVDPMFKLKKGQLCSTNPMFFTVDRLPAGPRGFFKFTLETSKSTPESKPEELHQEVFNAKNYLDNLPLDPAIKESVLKTNPKNKLGLINSLNSKLKKNLKQAISDRNFAEKLDYSSVALKVKEDKLIKLYDFITDQIANQTGEVIEIDKFLQVNDDSKLIFSTKSGDTIVFNVEEYYSGGDTSVYIDNTVDSSFKVEQDNKAAKEDLSHVKTLLSKLLKLLLEDQGIDIQLYGIDLFQNYLLEDIKINNFQKPNDLKESLNNLKESFGSLLQGEIKDIFEELNNTIDSLINNANNCP